MNDIEKWFNDAAKDLQKQAGDRLMRLGFYPDGWVYREGKGKYKIKQISLSFSRWGGAYIGLHGNKLRGDGSLGEHVHYIGSPNECEDIYPE